MQRILSHDHRGNHHPLPRPSRSIPGKLGPRRILLVDDSDLSRRQLQVLLQVDADLRVDGVRDGVQALEQLEHHTYSLVITDLRMPGMDGMRLIEEIQKRRLPVTVIVTTGSGGVQEAVQAMRMGVYHFLTKPIDVDYLRLVVRYALQDRALQDEVAQLREQLQRRFAFHHMLSKNRAMHAIFELVNNLSHSHATVLIEGETGTGKEQLARAIHELSTDRPGPLVPVNCAALPESLLESELFGHEKGAFTSAVGQRRGRFELADKGTIFLDEVGDIPPTMQAKLLRVLQERRFERVGGSETIEVDVRVIAATNRPLLKLVGEGQFREDLYYRLNVVKIDLPPLRQRPEDVPLLARHFVEKYTTPGTAAKIIDPAAMQALLQYHWPGNIRQLENAIERACITATGDRIRRDNLPPEILEQAQTPRRTAALDLGRPLPAIVKEATAALERDYICKALEKTHGNIGKCARLCGLSRRSISVKLAQYQIDKTKWKINHRRLDVV
ncbi:MAG: sigma-54-dependent transcriptional regulator [Gemmataceae bacterium]